MNRKLRVHRLAPQDRELWQKLYYRHTSHRLRRRLLALRALWDGQTMIAVCRSQQVDRSTLERWLDLYLHGGFPALLAPIVHRPHRQALSPTRRTVLHYILLHKRPADYGLDSYQWTAPWVQALIEKKWGVHLGLGRIYQILHAFGLSHQRAHRDYGPSSPSARAAFLAELKKNRRTAGGWGTRGVG